MGVQASLAYRTFADRSRYGLCRGGRRRAIPLDGWWEKLERALGTARARYGTTMAARRRRLVPPHDYSRPERFQPDIHCHLGGGRISYRRWRPDVAADQ